MTIEFERQILIWGLTAALLLLAVVVLVLAGQVNRLTRRPRDYYKRSGDGSVEGDLEALRSRLDRLTADLASLRAEGDGALRRLGVVRYDAFRDMGGHMSFSVALLDARRNGLVISILNGRDGSRGYAKAVREGKSSSPLSDEEQQALAQALDLARVQ
ncbi:MAG TPA: DUF4446 family protein [bacterium]|jgi:hypothetical protein|nr:DUF4446 family protein [bacterium]